MGLKIPSGPLTLGKPGLQIYNSGEQAFDFGSIATLKGDWDFSAVAAGAIASHPDLSGNANTIAQGTGARQPTGVAAVQNGLNVARFDGGDSLSATFTLNQPETVFMVCRITTPALNVYLLDGKNIDSMSVFQSPVAGDLRMYAGAFGTKWTQDWTTFHVCTFQFNGASSILRVDGTVRATGFNVGAANGGGITIGSQSGSGTGVTGDVGRTLVYSTALSGANMTTIEAELKALWGTP